VRQGVASNARGEKGKDALWPWQFYAGLQFRAEARQTAPALPAGGWHASFVPSQVSAVHGLPSSVHAVPLGCFASAGQFGPLPGQNSATSHSPPDARHWVAPEAKASAGQLVLTPSQLSAESQTPAEARQTAPAFPAGCWHASFVPSQVSAVHGLPSSVHAVPLGCFASAGQFGPLPGQNSATSHSPPDARHWVPPEAKASAGQLVLTPSQLSAGSQTPAEARQTAPAFPAGCWHASFVPSQVSAVHGLPSSVHAVPLGCFASAGQFGPLPGQNSATSHSPTAARHWVAA